MKWVICKNIPYSNIRQYIICSVYVTMATYYMVFQRQMSVQTSHNGHDGHVVWVKTVFRRGGLEDKFCGMQVQIYFKLLNETT